MPTTKQGEEDKDLDLKEPWLRLGFTIIRDHALCHDLLTWNDH